MVADTTKAPGLLKVFSVIVNIVNMIRLLCGSPKIVKANGIDIIYCNGTLAKIVGTLIGRKNKKPVIWHVRNIQQTRSLKLLMETLSGFRCVKKIICVSQATAEPFEEQKARFTSSITGLTLRISTGSLSGVLLERNFPYPPIPCLWETPEEWSRERATWTLWTPLTVLFQTGA